MDETVGQEAAGQQGGGSVMRERNERFLAQNQPLCFRRRSAWLGVVAKIDGTVVDVNVGYDVGNPVLCVTDLLLHLGNQQMAKKGREGSRLNSQVLRDGLGMAHPGMETRLDLPAHDSWEDRRNRGSALLHACHRVRWLARPSPCPRRGSGRLHAGVPDRARRAARGSIGSQGAARKQ